MAKHTGISFDGAHSSEDWELRLKSVEIGVPEAKTYYVDVPGMDGQLDLTEAMQNGVKYDDRTLTFVFDARYCSYVHWAGLLSLIAQAIQGRKVKIVLDIDSGYYYYGRCSINTQKSNEANAEITVECTCEPYKYEVSTSDEPWLWDPFSFIDGMAVDTADISINSTSAWQAVTLIGKPWNDTLTVISDATMTMKYNDTEYAIAAGTNVLTELVLEEGEQTLYFNGKGTVTIVHRGGRI